MGLAAAGDGAGSDPQAPPVTLPGPAGRAGQPVRSKNVF